jgi:hypothetical protein
VAEALHSGAALKGRGQNRLLDGEPWTEIDVRDFTAAPRTGDTIEDAAYHLCQCRSERILIYRWGKTTLTKATPARSRLPDDELSAASKLRRNSTSEALRDSGQPTLGIALHGQLQKDQPLANLA